MVKICAPIFLIAGRRGMRERKGPDPLLEEVFRRTGVRRPTIGYVGAASGENVEFRLLMATRLQKAGAGKVILAPLCGRRRDAGRAKSVLEASDLVFFSGGDVEEGIGVLKEKGITDDLKRLYREGKPFFGVSAGTIMLARRWIRWADPDDDASSELLDCLGLAPILCDTHGEDEDWEELRALLGLSPVGRIGHGIASGTAIVVEPEGAVSALGGDVHRFKRLARGVVPIESLVPAETPRPLHSV